MAYHKTVDKTNNFDRKMRLMSNIDPDRRIAGNGAKERTTIGNFAAGHLFIKRKMERSGG